MQQNFPFHLQKNDQESCQRKDLRETVLADLRVLSWYLCRYIW